MFILLSSTSKLLFFYAIVNIYEIQTQIKIQANPSTHSLDSGSPWVKSKGDLTRGFMEK